MAPKAGYNMKLYRNTGTVATPVWSEVKDVGDVSIADLSRGLAELKRRGSGFTKNLPTVIQSIAVEFTLFHGLDSTVFDGIRGDFFNGTVREWAVMNGAITTQDNEGLRCPMLVEQFPWNQNLEEASGHDVRLVVGYMEESAAEVDPSWYTVP